LDISNGLQQSAVDSAIDGECDNGGHFDIWQYANNMLIEREVIEAVKQCSKFIECVFQIG